MKARYGYLFCPMSVTLVLCPVGLHASAALGCARVSGRGGLASSLAAADVTRGSGSDARVTMLLLSLPRYVSMQ